MVIFYVDQLNLSDISSFLFVLSFIQILTTQEGLVGNSTDRSPSLEAKDRGADYEYPPINDY